MYSIRLEHCGHEFACAPGQTLLEATRQRGVRCLRTGCLGGGCGICKIRIVRGDYTVGKMSRGHVREEAQAAGFALACKVWPRSDLVLEVMSSGHDAQVHPWRSAHTAGIPAGGE